MCRKTLIFLMKQLCQAVKVTQSCLTLCYPMDGSPWNSPGQNTGGGRLSVLQGSSQLKDQIQVSSIAGGSLPAEPPGKPKNTGVHSLSLLQGIFLTQELNQGLLNGRRILYHLSYYCVRLVVLILPSQLFRTSFCLGL